MALIIRLERSRLGFYDEEKTANQYIAMADGYDGRELIDVLRAHLPDGASILELGMGPGVDLDIEQLRKSLLRLCRSRYLHRNGR